MNSATSSENNQPFFYQLEFLQTYVLKIKKMSHPEFISGSMIFNRDSETSSE